MQMQGGVRCESTVLAMDIDLYNWVKRRNGKEKGEKKKERPKKGEKKTWLKKSWHENLHDDSDKYHHNGKNNTAHFILGTWYIFYALMLARFLYYHKGAPLHLHLPPSSLP